MILSRIGTYTKLDPGIVIFKTRSTDPDLVNIGPYPQDCYNTFIIYLGLTNLLSYPGIKEIPPTWLVPSIKGWCKRKIICEKMSG